MQCIVAEHLAFKEDQGKCTSTLLQQEARYEEHVNFERKAKEKRVQHYYRFIRKTKDSLSLQILQPGETWVFIYKRQRWSIVVVICEVIILTK